MNSVKSYQDLEIWKKSMHLAEAIYLDSKTFPADGKYGLTSRIRRAAISIPANIAEGAARAGTRAFLQFLSVAGGSPAEMETFPIMAKRLQILGKERTQQLLALCEEISRMPAGRKRSLRSKI